MNHKGTVTLETERLILRRFKAEDAEAMFRNWASDPEVTKYARQGVHKVIKESTAACGEIVSSYTKDDFYYWAVVLKDFDEPIGRINIAQVNEIVKMVHVSYMIGRRFWSKGYTTEALSAVMRFFFEEVGANRIEGRNDPQNPPSEKVMLKCGFQYEGLLRKGGKNSFGLVDCKQYAILAEDYFNKAIGSATTGFIEKNIVISGVPRAGKTTLCRMLMRRGYTHISMDAIIAGFEKCYPETGINTYQELSSMETMRTISAKIAPFIRAMIEGEYSGYEGERAVFDLYQLLPEDYMKHLASSNCTVHWLGSSDCTAEERFDILKANDTEQHYTFYKSETELREGCGYIVEQSRMLRQQCEKYGLPYSDTTYKRDDVLESVFSNIAN